MVDLREVIRRGGMCPTEFNCRECHIDKQCHDISSMVIKDRLLVVTKAKIMLAENFLANKLRTAFLEKKGTVNGEINANS
jgi:hypothetical protein